MKTVQEAEISVTRRRLLAWVGWGSFAAFWGSSALAMARFCFPRILYEPSARFQAGKPEDYQVGEISTRFKKSQRVWMIRTPQAMPPDTGKVSVGICTTSLTVRLEPPTQSPD